MATTTTNDLVAPGDPGKPRKAPPSRTRSLVEWVVVVAGAVAVAFLVKTFVVQAFFIPSVSMKPTLEVGDRVLVNKLSYRLHDVNRFDVVVFERPEGENEDIKDLIKRVIALPGEKVVFKDGRVWVDDQPLDESAHLPLGSTSEPRQGAGYQHLCTVEDPCIIPPGTVWVMGDNRGSSKDSRYFGPIPQDRIVGRAFVIVWPFDRFGGL